jgi:2-iminobutanoate/2-iminopropanoate deaminase
MRRQAIVPEAVEALPLPFSPAIRSGPWLFVSGQASVDDRGALVPGSFEAEMRRSMENLAAVLAAAGCSLDDVVQVRAYLGDVDDAPEFNRLYREYFAEPLPARTTLAGCIGMLKFEVDAVARLPQEGGR